MAAGPGAKRKQSCKFIRLVLADSKKKKKRDEEISGQMGDIIPPGCRPPASTHPVSSVIPSMALNRDNWQASSPGGPDRRFLRLQVRLGRSLSRYITSVNVANVNLCYKTSSMPHDGAFFSITFRFRPQSRELCHVITCYYMLIHVVVSLTQMGQGELLEVQTTSCATTKCCFAKRCQLKVTDLHIRQAWASGLDFQSENRSYAQKRESNSVLINSARTILGRRFRVFPASETPILLRVSRFCGAFMVILF